jgi:hypothetical protein
LFRHKTDPEVRFGKGNVLCKENTQKRNYKKIASEKAPACSPFFQFVLCERATKHTGLTIKAAARYMFKQNWLLEHSSINF